MKVCYLGPYNPEHIRSRIIIRELKKNGIEVIECNAVSNYRLLDYLKLLNKIGIVDCDVIILGARGDYYGQPLVPFVKHMTKKPIVFDTVLALYETEVMDQKHVDSRSFKAKLFYQLDYSALQNATLVLSDTFTHAKYYSSFYNVEFNKFRRVFIGSDDEIFYPRIMKKEENDNFLVTFWGGFIPLQGVRYIIEAAKILENYKDIKFELRGFGQTYAEALELSRKLEVKNVTFISKWLHYKEFPNYVTNADICMGIFGDTSKAQRVIPAKAMDTMAMRKPLITGDSPAAREIFKDRENCMLVPMANPKALAEAILTLKADKELRDKIAENGYRLFKEKLSPKTIGKELKSILMELAEKSK